MYTIRHFDHGEEDYQTALQIAQAVYPEHRFTLEAMRYEDQKRNPALYYKRSFVLRDGEAVGYGAIGETEWNASPDQYYMVINVLPDQRRQGAGAYFYEHACAVFAERGAQSVMSWVREDRPYTIRFLQRRGFRQVQRNARSRLHVTDYDFERIGDPAPALAAKGIVIRTLSELKQQDPDWKQKALDLSNISARDMPRTEPFKPASMQQFETWLDHPHTDHDCWFYAVDSATGDFVGISNIYYDPQYPARHFVGYTGVHSNYRRMGIATALKLCTIRAAQRNGADVIETDNEESNPMYQLNLMLGFEPLPADLDFKKELNFQGENDDYTD